MLDVEKIITSVKKALIKQEKLTTVPIAKNEEDDYVSRKDVPKLIKNLEKQMHAAAKNLEFEKAAELRDRVKKIREKDLFVTP